MRKTLEIISVLEKKELKTLKQSIFKKHIGLEDNLSELLLRLVNFTIKLDSDFSDFYADYQELPINGKNRQFVRIEEELNQKSAQLSKINKKLEFFLIKMEVENDEDLKNRILLRSLSKRKSSNLLKKHFKHASEYKAKEYNPSGLGSFYHQWYVYHVYYYSSIIRKREKRRNEAKILFKEFVNHFDKFKAFETLKTELEKTERNIIFKEGHFVEANTKPIALNQEEETALSLMNELLSKESYESFPLLEKIYNTFILLLDKLPYELRYDISLHILNRGLYLLRRSSKEDKSWMFEIYKTFYSKDLLSYRGQLRPSHFMNIIGLGLDTGNVIWVKEFIDETGLLCSFDEQLIYKQISMARLEFANSKYDEVIPILSRLENIDELQVIILREQLYLMTFLALSMQGKDVPLEDKCSAFIRMLSRWKNISENLCRQLEKFTVYVKKMDKAFNQINSTHVIKEKLKQEIIEEKGLAHKKWFLNFFEKMRAT